MKNTTNTKVCDEQDLDFVQEGKIDSLKPNQYYALMVCEDKDEKSPHILGREIYNGRFLVGIERPNLERGVYLSKNYNSRRAPHRGYVIIVETENPKNYTILK